MPSLFEPFRRMQARTGVRDGVGLGLSITRSVVTAHRATVTARSQPAGGLDITVVIPRCLAVEPHPSRPGVAKLALPTRPTCCDSQLESFSVL